jgi:hypothetical protein
VLGSGGIDPPFFTWALEVGVSGQFHAQDMASYIHSTEGWVGHRVSLDAVEKRNSFRLPRIELGPSNPSLYSLTHTYIHTYLYNLTAIYEPIV